MLDESSGKTGRYSHTLPFNAARAAPLLHLALLDKLISQRKRKNSKTEEKIEEKTEEKIEEEIEEKTEEIASIVDMPPSEPSAKRIRRAPDRYS